MSNITVTELQGHTSGGDANKVKIKTGHDLEVVNGATTLGGDLTVDTTSLKVDSSNNRVGIGTSSPLAPLNASYIDASRNDLLLLTNRNTGGYGPWINFYGDYNGGYSFAKIGAENDSTGGSMRFHTANTSGTSTEQMRIDNSGRVTMPNQPAFSTYGTAGNVGFQAEATITAWNTMIFNEGNHFDTSTGKFTAPVNGKYFFRSQLYMQNSVGVCRLRIYKNNSVAVYHYYNSYLTPGPGNIQGFLNLAANDTVHLTFNADNATDVYFADNHSNFDGWLVM